MKRVQRVRRLQRVGAAAALIAVLTLVWGAIAPPAGAHAVLLGTDPAADQVVSTPPTELVLDFSEGVEVAGDGVRVLDPSGDEVDGVTSTAEGTTVRADLPDLDLDGSYTVNWSAVSADGHPVRGAYLFHVGERTLDEPADAVTGGTPLPATTLRVAGAVLALAGLVGVFAASLRGRRPPSRWLPVVIGSLLGAAGAVLAVGDGWSTSIGVVVDTASGRMGLIAVAVAVAGSVAAWFPRAAQLELALAAAATVAVAAQGHAVSIPPVALSAGLTVAHVVAAVVWATALVWLDLAARASEPSGFARAVTRWSPWGMAAVVVLAASGTVLVLERVDPGELTTSTYGRLALVKVALLVLALVLAARNRWRLTPAVARSEEVPTAADGTDPVRRLRSSLRAEIVVLALALVAGAVLAQVPPPEVAAGAPAGGQFEQRLAFGDGQVELTVAPGRRGSNEMHVTALGADGRLMDGIDDLTLRLRLPSEGIGPLEPQMQPITTGHAVSYAEIPLAGTWSIEVVAHPSKFEELTAEFTVPIGE